MRANATGPHICNEALQRGELVRILPEWATPPSTAHLVFTSRHGLLPAVRAFINYVGERIPPLIDGRRKHEAA
jgi:DNA-binding transcriptional LysR family regulator